MTPSGVEFSFFLSAQSSIATDSTAAWLQASTPQGFPFFGMPPSVLSALSQTELQVMRSSSSSDRSSLLASAQMSDSNSADGHNIASGMQDCAVCEIA